jgi:hypothetical protein
MYCVLSQIPHEEQGLKPAPHVKSVLKHVTLFSVLKPAPHVESVLKHNTLFAGLNPAPHVESDSTCGAGLRPANNVMCFKTFHMWSRIKT